MLNSKLLVSGADYFADDYKINPYYTETTIDVNKAREEHAEIIKLFKKAGIEIIKVDPPKNCQDGVYTANWALVKDGVAVMARLPKARQAEESYARKILESLGIKCITPQDDLLFSGQGDSLRLGQYLFAGNGYRSDLTAQTFAADILNLKLIQLHTKPELNPDGSTHINPFTNHADSFFYDLDLALSIIDDHTIAYCPEAFDDESNAKIEEISDLDKIIVTYEECVSGFACNLVSTGKHVIMSNNAPIFQKQLENRGLTCFTPDVTELKKGGGYIRCISLWLS